MDETFESTLFLLLVDSFSESLSIAGSRQIRNKGGQVFLEQLRVSDAEEDKKLVLLGQTGPGIIRIKSETGIPRRVLTYQMSPWMFFLLGGAILTTRSIVSSCSRSRKRLLRGEGARDMQSFLIILATPYNG